MSEKEFEKWANSVGMEESQKLVHEVTWDEAVRQAEVRLREPMSCGHPRGCRRPEPNYPPESQADVEELSCLVCQAAKEACDAALLEAAKHRPLTSDLVGWFSRCSCGADCETEQDWIDHIQRVWERLK